MDNEYLMHLNRLLSLLEEDAYEIRHILKGEILSPYVRLLDREIAETKQELRQEKENNWR